MVWSSIEIEDLYGQINERIIISKFFFFYVFFSALFPCTFLSYLHEKTSNNEESTQTGTKKSDKLMQASITTNLRNSLEKKNRQQIETLESWYESGTYILWKAMKWNKIRSNIDNYNYIYIFSKEWEQKEKKRNVYVCMCACDRRSMWQVSDQFVATGEQNKNKKEMLMLTTMMMVMMMMKWINGGPAFIHINGKESGSAKQLRNF